MSRPHDIDSEPLKGILICLAGYLFIALMGMLKKCLTVPVPLSQILFFQSAICFLMLMPNILRKGITLVHRNTLSTYLVRIASGLGCCFSLFYLIGYVPISQAFLYQYSASLWIPFVSAFWLRKYMPKNLWFGIIFGFIGIAFILRPKGLLNWVAPIGLICSLTQAISVVAIRKLSETEPFLNILFYYFLVSVLVTGVLSSFVWHSLDSFNFFILLAIGLATYFAQKLITLSLRYASASTLAPICYTSLVFSGLFGWFFWQELPDRTTIIGMLLVIAGCLMTVYTSKLNYRYQRYANVVE